MVENFRSLFEDVYKVYSNAKQHEEEMKERGEKYSVFSALGVERSELIHSAFIKDLLDPKGMHGMKDTFLKSFLNHVGLDEDFLESTSVISIKEMYIGVKTEKSGGQVDIVLDDHKGGGVIIENKVDAGDQENQLLRYDNYAKKYFKKDYRLLYLTLDGHKPSASSIDNKELDKLHLISYRKEILEWLKDCVKQAYNKPLIRETINQYIQLLKKLTNMTMDEQYLKDTAACVIKNKSNVEAVTAIIQSRSHISSALRNRMFGELEKYAEENNLSFEKRHEDNPCIILSREEWHSYILIKSDNKKGEKRCWKNMFITVSGSDKKEWLPNEYRDWHETESYIAMYNGDITKWIEDKVDKMLCEIKEKNAQL